MPDPIRGSCLCGTIQFLVDGRFRRMIHCHCSICRKSHGAAFATFVTADSSNFHWVKGEGQRSFFQSSPAVRRAFCPTCGSPVPPAPAGAAEVHIPASCLVGTIAVPPAVHAFVDSKADWFEITDDLPCFGQYAPRPGNSRSP
jgi:hypothetical protein